MRSGHAFEREDFKLGENGLMCQVWRCPAHAHIRLALDSSVSGRGAAGAKASASRADPVHFDPGAHRRLPGVAPAVGRLVVGAGGPGDERVPDAVDGLRGRAEALRPLLSRRVGDQGA